ncbi:MAG: radical SAM protein [Iphinoe sp. HA4291-MV1]|jgi:radical SAM protein with 4Fe4S-binding SPASM domain|nr:radical SAM protein [Iphinoe sp. HA4291-MV1]
MKPKSDIKFDRIAFEKMKRIMPNLLEAKRQQQTNEDHVRRLPEEIAFKLTNSCNLRCVHCYQWNEDGHHHDMERIEQNRDLDFSIIEKVFAETHETKSNVYLWGGEPLIYKDWNKLVDLLEKDPRWTSMCTNGIGIKRNLESLLRISEHFEVLVAIEGFKDEHDAIRGKGTYEKAIEAIDLLLEQKRQGNYKGEIAVNCVITDKMVIRIYEIMEFFEAKQIDTVYLSLLWYLSDETTAKMDEHAARHFNWLFNEEENGRPSWHAYKYRLNPNNAEKLIEELNRVNQRNWRIKLRYNPALDVDEVKEFILGSDKPAQNKTKCLAIKNRMDIFPNGEVISCKFFPEFSVGDLKAESVHDIWHGCKFTKVRETIDNEGLMPVCAKCNLLYSRGI